MEIPRYWRGNKIRYKDLGLGKIYMFSENIAIVELSNGQRITAQLTDFDKVPAINDSVECVIRKLKVEGDGDRGLIIYGQKFRPQMFSSKATSMFSK